LKINVNNLIRALINNGRNTTPSIMFMLLIIEDYHPIRVKFINPRLDENSDKLNPFVYFKLFIEAVNGD
jgi:hypothetical protein